LGVLFGFKNRVQWFWVAKKPSNPVFGKHGFGGIAGILSKTEVVCRLAGSDWFQIFLGLFFGQVEVFISRI